MATVTYVLALIVMPLVWWPVVAVGIFAYWRTRLTPVLLVVIGSLLLGILGLQSLLFRPDASYDSAGNAQVFTVDIVPVEWHLVTSSIGAILVVLGIVLLLVRIGRSRVDT